jgi:hypothetical protein
MAQEVASRGVALVYDRSDAATRAQLVKSLVGGLSSEGQQAKLTVRTPQHPSSMPRGL